MYIYVVHANINYTFKFWLYKMANIQYKCTGNYLANNPANFFLSSFLFKILFYLFLEGKGGKKRKRNIMCGCLLCAPYWGPGLPPRHVPWLGIKPATLWFADQRSIHWASPAGATLLISVKFQIQVQTARITQKTSLLVASAQIFQLESV